MGGVKEIKNGFMKVHDNDMGVLNKFSSATTHWKNNIIPFATPQTKLQIDIVFSIYGQNSETFWDYKLEK